MNTNSLFFSLAPLSLLLATNLNFHQLPLFQSEAYLSNKPALSEYLFLHNSSQPRPIQAKLNKPFNLKYAQKAVVKNDALTITFVKINDSRCPINARCITAGQAVVVLNVVKQGRNLGEVVLTSKPDSPDLAVKTLEDNSTITLLDIPTQPTAPLHDQKDYTIKLVVSKK